MSLLAMAYFYERIFPQDTLIEDSFYTINSVKGFFDACNHTQYTPIYELDTTYYKLRETALFNACYLIIQCAWFFNSEYFGRHQYLEYASHYIKTGEQLPIEQYRYDTGDLLRKYSKIDENRNTEFHPTGEPAFKFVEQWYFYILYLVCVELEVSTQHFKANTKDFREYNPLTKCPRILRAETPFKVIECDIKSAFPSFLDLQTGSTIKGKVYSNLMERKKITRSQAKILYNSYLNSGKYKSAEEIRNFLVECGYTISQADEITKYTNGKVKFITHMSELEELAIQDFKQNNDLKKAVRLHDSVLFIDTGGRHFDLKAENGIIEFGFSCLKHPVYSNSFGYSNKGLRFAYISSLPTASNENYKDFVKKRDFKKPPIKGRANGFIFYTEKYEYITASFDLNQKYTYEEFLYNCKSMISTLNYLNEKPVTKIQLLLILRHIRENSNIIFNVRYLFKELLKCRNEKTDIIIQQRDFEVFENFTFKRKIDFLNALNTARGEVNKKLRLAKLLQLIEKRFSRNDFTFIQYKMKGKAKTNELIKAILLRINKLCTGNIRKPKAQTVKKNPLYISSYKEGISYPFEPNKFSNTTRIAQRKIQVYEKELLSINRLVNNREIAFQYVHIFAEITGKEIIIPIQREKDIIQKEKAFLIQQITNKQYKTIKQAERVFNKEYLPKHKKEVESQVPKLEDFNTSLIHSAFNIEPQEAYERGDQFFYEYLKFNAKNPKRKDVTKIQKQKFEFPQIDFGL
ncbi:hypothetical protein [Bizionia paragorgiae]|uniref:hypothetical protein n=1 Tax=Bizionia paragorgiae TaxID=283786 RepID=UPI003A91AA2F